MYSRRQDCPGCVGLEVCRSVFNLIRVPAPAHHDRRGSAEQGPCIQSLPHYHVYSSSCLAFLSRTLSTYSLDP